jgi:hypothetical protein
MDGLAGLVRKSPGAVAHETGEGLKLLQSLCELLE